MRTAFDAVIVGAGPAGSSAAILLARAGWSVALIEKQAFPRRKVCGECIAASNLPLLDALGVGEAFAARAGPPLRQVALMRGERSIVAALPAADDVRHPWGRALGRETLDPLLVGAARRAGVHVFQPWSAQAIEGGPGAWRCTVRPVGAGPGALLLRAPVAIDAHGSWEALPAGRARRRGGRGAGELLAFKANFTGVDLDDGLLPVLSFPGGYGGMVVADGGVTTLAACVRRDRLEAWRRARPGMPAGDVVEAMLQRDCGGVRTALERAHREGAWLAAGPLAPGIRLRADDTLLRIGNAAGEAHPIIGEGMSMALQSSWLLCAELLAPAFDPRGATRQRALARRYAQAWRHAFAPRLRLAALFAHAAMRPAASALLMPLAVRWPALLTHGARWGGKITPLADATTTDSLPALAAMADADAALRRGSPVDARRSMRSPP